MSTGSNQPTIDELPRYNARERRILGVLIEKGKTTPDYYPMTLAGLVTSQSRYDSGFGCVGPACWATLNGKPVPLQCAAIPAQPPLL